MRNKIFVRPATAEDAPLFWQWALRNKDKNGFDPAVLDYPNTLTFCAFDQDGPLAFMPFQQPLLIDASAKPVKQTPIFLEGLAPRPGLSFSQTASVIKELVQTAVTLGFIQGQGEIYFLGTEEATSEMAVNQLFEKLPYPVYRLRMSDLEKKQCE